MMACPFCIKGKTIVIDSRWDESYKTIRRRRHCLACSYRWTTLEIDLDQILNIVAGKNDQNPPMDHPMEKDASIDSEDD